MVSSNTDAIIYWNNLSLGMNRYFSIIIFLFGTIGSILNIFVLSHRELRNNSCSLYFLSSSIANLIAICFGLTTRMLSGWALDLTNTIDWLCKLRAFVLFFSRNIALWTIMFAAFDRWLLSSGNIHHRAKSTLKNAFRTILLIITLSAIIYSPIFYCYKANLIQTPLKCYGETSLCRISNDLLYAFVTILFPIIIMFIFGLQTIFNIRHVRNRIGIVNITVAKQKELSRKKLDRQLFLMLFIQIILLSLFTLPQAIQKLYTTYESTQAQTSLDTVIETFAFNFVLLLTYVANGMPFYIYTLCGGTVFRNVLTQMIQKCIQKY
ncbi:hypothetical protein I4U23_020393 [Adineta vaga]|nr:hypothetical protein I4U23_020393 [Adineta vaga]